VYRLPLRHSVAGPALGNGVGVGVAVGDGIGTAVGGADGVAVGLGTTVGAAVGAAVGDIFVLGVAVGTATGGGVGVATGLVVAALATGAGTEATVTLFPPPPEQPPAADARANAAPRTSGLTLRGSINEDNSDTPCSVSICCSMRAQYSIFDSTYRLAAMGVERSSVVLSCTPQNRRSERSIWRTETHVRPQALYGTTSAAYCKIKQIR